MTKTRILEELDLVEPKVHKGRPGVPISADYVRDLTEADIVATKLERGKGAHAPVLQQVRYSHHALAKLIAIGTSANQCAMITGYNPIRIQQLMKDATFKALVEDYREESKDTVANMTLRMSNISLDALEELQQRLHDSPEEFSIPTLLDLVRSFADRTGHGPGAKLDISMSADTIDRPPREGYEEWSERRKKESGSEDLLESTVGTTNGGNNRRLVS